MLHISPALYVYQKSHPFEAYELKLNIINLSNIIQLDLRKIRCIRNRYKTNQVLNDKKTKLLNKNIILIIIIIIVVLIMILYGAADI